MMTLHDDFFDEHFKISFIVSNNLAEDYLHVAQVHTLYGWKKDAKDPG